MLEFLDFENFSWGIVLGLFAVVALLGATLGLTQYLDIETKLAPLYTLLAFTMGMVLLEGGLIVYMRGVKKGSIHSEERKNNLILKLNSIKSAREDVEEGFMHREMDKESRDKMLRDLKQKELETKNQLKALQKKEDFDIDLEDI
ncbi:MAG: hypothetical protein ACLFTQ_01090 [Candidatus Aenigmatarchaeota archaeon]